MSLAIKQATEYSSSSSFSPMLEDAHNVVREKLIAVLEKRSIVLKSYTIQFQPHSQVPLNPRNKIYSRNSRFLLAAKCVKEWIRKLPPQYI